MKKKEEELQEGNTNSFLSKLLKAVFGKIKKNKMKTVKIIFGAVLLILAFIGGKSLVPEKPEKTTDTIREEIVKIGELASLEYNYTKLSQRTIGSDSINPFHSDEKLLYTFDGVIKMGIDCTQIDMEKEDKTIKVKMPPAMILSHEVDEDSYRSYIEEGNFETEEFSKYRSEDMQEQEEKIINNGGLDRAYESAEEILRNMISMAQADQEQNSYTIVFELMDAKN